MIEFRQKMFSEYEAMKTLYNKLMRDFNWKTRIERIDRTALIPKLKGNNVVIERFVINRPMIGPDRYRLYLKLGAKVKMPNDVALPGKTFLKRAGGINLNFNSAIFGKKFSATEETKLFGDGNKPAIGAEFRPNVSLEREVTKQTARLLKYDKPARSVVLEFDKLEDVISALDSLPFGLDYKLCILDVC